MLIRRFSLNLTNRLSSCLFHRPKSIWTSVLDVAFGGKQNSQNVVYLIRFDDGAKYIGTTSRPLSQTVMQKCLDQNSRVGDYLNKSEAKMDKVHVFFQSDCEKKLKEAEAEIIENYSLFYPVLNVQQCHQGKSQNELLVGDGNRLNKL